MLQRLAVFCIITQVICKEVIESTVTFHGITDTLRTEHEKYAQALVTAAEAFRDAESYFDDDAYVMRRGWKKETELDNGDAVYSKSTDNGKMVTLSTVLDGNVDAVMKDIWTGLETVPTWDPNMDFASYIVTLSNYSDIVTYGNNDVFLITGRDLVTARLHRPLPNGGYRMAYRSVTIDEKPETKDRVRAHLYLGAIQFRPHPDHPETKTLYDVITLFDLKGMLPKFLINQIVPKIMVMDTQNKMKHFKELAEKKQ